MAAELWRGEFECSVVPALGQSVVQPRAEAEAMVLFSEGVAAQWLKRCGGKLAP
jgi:hypothetical protein